VAVPADTEGTNSLTAIPIRVFGPVIERERRKKHTENRKRGKDGRKEA
jgi:hypothetical protein